MIFLRQPVSKSCYEPASLQNICPSSQYGVVFLTPNPSSACAKQQQQQHKPDAARRHERLHERQQQQQRRTAETKQTTKNMKKDAPADASVIVQKPRIHQEETATNITMALDVAGYSINDLNIHIDQETNILAISGARVNRLGSKYVFQRRLALKVVRLNLDTFHATLKDDGILEISVQKRDHRSSRVIPIRAAAATTNIATTMETEPMDVDKKDNRNASNGGKDVRLSSDDASIAASASSTADAAGAAAKADSDTSHISTASGLTLVETVEADDDDGEKNDAVNYSQNDVEQDSDGSTTNKHNESASQTSDNVENVSLDGTVVTVNGSSSSKTGDMAGEDNTHNTIEDVLSWERV